MPICLPHAYTHTPSLNTAVHTSVAAMGEYGFVFLLFFPNHYRLSTMVDGGWVPHRPEHPMLYVFVQPVWLPDRGCSPSSSTSCKVGCLSGAAGGRTGGPPSASRGCSLVYQMKRRTAQRPPLHLVPDSQCVELSRGAARY